MVPWYYRVRFTNWLIAKPWRWNYRAIYRTFMQYPTGRRHRLLSLWYTITFPHVHHPNED